jgi:hypothetical protein
MLVHVPVVSAAHAASMEEPSLITVDPSGVVGVTMAETRGRRANRIEANIVSILFIVYGLKCGVGMSVCRIERTMYVRKE